MSQRTTTSNAMLSKGLDPADYEIDEVDDLPRELVGSWAADKYALLRRYVEISGKGVRKKWLQKPRSAGATYIDLYSGPGRVRIRDTEKVLDGGPLVAWRQSLDTQSAFTQVFVADVKDVLADAACRRLRTAGAPVEIETGPAVATIDRLLPKLNRYALHFAFLDPYSLGALPFSVIEKLAGFERMDILMHVSVQDLNRNLRKYATRETSPLDAFAPGWREHVGDLQRQDEYIRARIFEHWRNRLKALGMETAEAAELISGGNRQPLYWLAFIARHSTALKFWEKIRELHPDGQAPLL